jgi:WD40 repeat protein
MESIPSVLSHTPIYILISIPSGEQGQGQSISTPNTMRIWDTQKGAVINDIDIDGIGEVVFSGAQGTITHIVEGDYHTYDLPTGTRLCNSELLQSHNHQLGAHWTHGEFLRFATSLEIDGRFVIDVRELQPTSDPPLLVVESLPVPPQGGRFSFSPVSFHASFVSETEVIILDVRDSKVLLQTKTTQLFYTPPGHFSPNGRFLACRSSREEIFTWENTTAGYVPWNPLRPQSPPEGFLFSPTAISILSWGPGGVQLLHPSNHVNTLPTSKIEPHGQGNNHLLVASPTGRTHVTTTQQEGIARSAIVNPGRVCFYF